MWVWWGVVWISNGKSWRSLYDVISLYYKKKDEGIIIGYFAKVKVFEAKMVKRMILLFFEFLIKSSRRKVIYNSYFPLYCKCILTLS